MFTLALKISSIYHNFKSFPTVYVTVLQSWWQILQLAPQETLFVFLVKPKRLENSTPALQERSENWATRAVVSLRYSQLSSLGYCSTAECGYGLLRWSFSFSGTARRRARERERAEKKKRSEPRRTLYYNSSQLCRGAQLLKHGIFGLKFKS